MQNTSFSNLLRVEYLDTYLHKVDWPLPKYILRSFSLHRSTSVWSGVRRRQCTFRPVCPTAEYTCWYNLDEPDCKWRQKESCKLLQRHIEANKTAMQATVSSVGNAWYRGEAMRGLGGFEPFPTLASRANSGIRTKADKKLLNIPSPNRYNQVIS